MAQTILGVFDDALAARRAIEELRASPRAFDDVSIISRATESGEPISSDDDVSAGEGAAVGAVWGGLVGLAALLIPGVGPFIAGGALFAALTGAVTGAVVGGITAALVDFGGIPEHEARGYEEQVRAGKTLVAVKARDEDATEARRILASAGAASIRDNQTDLASSTSPVQVAMYDERGNRVNQEAEYGAPERATTTRGIYDMPVIDRDPNMSRPVVEPRPTTASSAAESSTTIGSGRAGQVQPTGTETTTGLTDLENERVTTPDKPAVPRATDPDTNLPGPDNPDRRA